MAKARGSFEDMHGAEPIIFKVRRRGMWVVRAGDVVTDGDIDRVGSDELQFAGTHVRYDSYMPNFFTSRIGNREIPRIKVAMSGIKEAIDNNNVFVDEEESRVVMDVLCPGMDEKDPENLPIGRSVGPGNLMVGVEGTEDGFTYLFPGMSIMTGNYSRRSSDSWSSHWILEDPSVYTSTGRRERGPVVTNEPTGLFGDSHRS